MRIRFQRFPKTYIVCIIEKMNLIAKGIEQFFVQSFFKMFHNSVVLTGIEKNMLKQLGKKYNQHIIQKGISEYLKIGKYKNIKEMVGMWNKILSRIGQKGKNDGTYQEYNK